MYCIVVKESESLRNRIIAGYKVIHEQESKITETFLNGVSTISGLKVYGKLGKFNLFLVRYLIFHLIISCNYHNFS